MRRHHILGKEAAAQIPVTKKKIIRPILATLTFTLTLLLFQMKREAEFKDKNSDLLKDLIPEKLEDVMLGANVVNVLVDRDHKGRRIMLHRAGGDWDTKKVSSDQVFQLFYLVHQGAVLEPATQVNGVVVILDFKDMGMSQVGALGLNFSQRLLTFIQVSKIKS